MGNFSETKTIVSPDGKTVTTVKISSESTGDTSRTFTSVTTTTTTTTTATGKEEKKNGFAQ